MAILRVADTLIKEEFFLLLSRSYSPSLSPATLSSAPAVSFFLGHQRDLNQCSSLALAFLSVYHTTRP